MPAAYWSLAGGSFCVWCLLQPLWDPLARLRSTAQGQKRRVAAIDIHPNWDPVNFSFDVAVVHLASAVSGIRPVMLVTPGGDALERPGTLATVTGWGIGCGATGFPGAYTRLSNRGVGNFVLEVTGGVPVTSARAA
jgi:secreted trypsin-like serine protease